MAPLLPFCIGPLSLCARWRDLPPFAGFLNRPRTFLSSSPFQVFIGLAHCGAPPHVVGLALSPATSVPGGPGLCSSCLNLAILDERSVGPSPAPPFTKRAVVAPSRFFPFVFLSPPRGPPRCLPWTLASRACPPNLTKTGPFTGNSPSGVLSRSFPTRPCVQSSPLFPLNAPLA